MNKSQRNIRAAFIKLLKAGNFQTIGIRDIIREADVARSTFYAYYEDKFQLLEEIETELIAAFVKIMLNIRENGRPEFQAYILQGNHPLFVEYFKLIKRNAEILRILFDERKGTDFTAKFIRITTEVRDETDKIWNEKERKPRNDMQRQYRAALLSAGYLSLFKTWLYQGMEYPEEKMGEYLTLIWLSGAFVFDDYKIEVHLKEK